MTFALALAVLLIALAIAAVLSGAGFLAALCVAGAVGAYDRHQTRDARGVMRHASSRRGYLR